MENYRTKSFMGDSASLFLIAILFNATVAISRFTGFVFLIWQLYNFSAYLLLASEDAVREYNLTPLARLVGYSSVGVEPSIMGVGPVPAIQNVLKVTGKTLNDLDLIEINEAFGAQTLACAKQLNLDVSKLNVNGGAIVLGHPLGASGARITVHLVHELRRRKAKLGVGSTCIGGGQGIALLIEAL